jgi:hypothetical protein
VHAAKYASSEELMISRANMNTMNAPTKKNPNWQPKKAA